MTGLRKTGIGAIFLSFEFKSFFYHYITKHDIPKND